MLTRYVKNKQQILFIKNKKSILLSIMLIALYPLPSKADNEDSNEIKYTLPEYGYKANEVTQEIMNKIHEEFKLPQRLNEFEQPEKLSKKAGELLNEGIPLVIRTIHERQIKKQDITKQLASNTQNTQSIESIIDLNEYINMDDIADRKRTKEITDKYLNKEITKQEIEKQMEDIVFPVTTDLRPTRMPSARMELTPEAKRIITTPMVFIGMDKYSLDWLQINIEAIKKFNPPIFVTQVDSLIDLQQLKRLIPDFKLIPIRGDEALKMYGVDFYPVMITKDGIFQ